MSILLTVLQTQKSARRKNLSLDAIKQVNPVLFSVFTGVMDYRLFITRTRYYGRKMPII